MKDNKKSAFKKTEEVLRNYRKLKYAADEDSEDREKTKKLIRIIQHAISTIEDDPYYAVIPMIFFEGETREQVAEYCNVDVKTITRNKNRLVNQLKVIIFSDETITELFL